MSGEVLVRFPCRHGRHVTHTHVSPNMNFDICNEWREVRLRREWECLIPEYGDGECVIAHKPENALMPSKHRGCGWHLWQEVTDE